MVEKINESHVAQVMDSLGWRPGAKLPTLAAINTKLKELFNAVGDGNTLSAKRAAVIAAAGCGSAVESLTEPIESGIELPKELSELLQQAAGDLGAVFGRLDKNIAGYIAQIRAEFDRDATARVNDSMKKTAVHLEESEEELVAALTAMGDRDIQLERMSTEVAEARQDAAIASGMVEAMKTDLTEKAMRLSEYDSKLEAAVKLEASTAVKLLMLQDELTDKANKINEQSCEMLELHDLASMATGKVVAVEKQVKYLEDELAGLKTRVITELEPAVSAAEKTAAVAIERSAAQQRELTEKDARIEELKALLMSTTQYATLDATGCADEKEKHLRKPGNNNGKKTTKRG